MNTPAWLQHCDGALKQARALRADFLILLDETPDGVTTGSAIIGDGPQGEKTRKAMQALVADGKAVCLSEDTKPDGGAQDVPRIGATARRSPSGIWQLETAGCPFCGARRHFHGGGGGAEPDAGHRLPHCDSRYRSADYARGYFIVVERIVRNTQTRKAGRA